MGSVRGGWPPQQEPGGKFQSRSGDGVWFKSHRPLQTKLARTDGSFDVYRNACSRINTFSVIGAGWQGPELNQQRSVVQILFPAPTFYHFSPSSLRSVPPFAVPDSKRLRWGEPQNTKHDRRPKLCGLRSKRTHRGHGWDKYTRSLGELFLSDETHINHESVPEDWCWWCRIQARRCHIASLGSGGKSGQKGCGLTQAGCYRGGSEKAFNGFVLRLHEDLLGRYLDISTSHTDPGGFLCAPILVVYP